MGESVARKIEAAMGRPHGWLDRLTIAEAEHACQFAAAAWSLDALLSGLAERFHAASPAVRESTGELLLRFAASLSVMVTIAGGGQAGQYVAQPSSAAQGRPTSRARFSCVGRGYVPDGTAQ